MSEPLVGPFRAALGRRALLQVLGGAGAFFVLSACGPNGGSATPSAAPSTSASTSAATSGASPTAAVTSTSAGTAVVSPTGASPTAATTSAPATNPTSGRVIGAAPIPKPPPTPGGVPPTPIGVPTISAGAAPPKTTPGAASGGSQTETGAPTTPISQAAATGTAVPGSNGANAAPVTSAATSTPVPAVTVTITADGKFAPPNVTVNVGQAVKWVNGGRYPQTVTDDPTLAANKSTAILPNGAPAWNSGILNYQQSFVRAFTVAGDYQYFSIPFDSKGMTGKITVK